MNYFEFTKKDYDYIVEQCMLDEEYSKLLEYKIKGYSRVKIAMELNVSESTLDKMLQKLKKKITKILWRHYKVVSFFYAIIKVKGDKVYMLF